MPAMSDYLANSLIDQTFMGVAYTPPITLYLALFEVAPTDISPGTEVIGGSYVRQVITFTNGAEAGSVASAADVTFVDMPVSTVVATAIMDASTVGNVLVYGNLITPRTVAAAETLLAETGTIIATFQ